MHTLSFFGEILDMFLAPEDTLLMQLPFPAKVQLCSSKTKHNFLLADNIVVFNMDEGCLFLCLVLGFSKMFCIKSQKNPHSLWERHSANRTVVFLSNWTLSIFFQPKSAVLELLPRKDLGFPFLKCHCIQYDLSSTPCQDGFISSTSVVCIHVWVVILVLGSVLVWMYYVMFSYFILFLLSRRAEIINFVPCALTGILKIETAEDLKKIYGQVIIILSLY